MRNVLAAAVAVVGMLCASLVSSAAGAADIRTIAIMPMASAPGNTVPGAIVGGLHSAVAAVLAQDPAFKVASDNDTGKYFDKDYTAAEAAKALGVRFIFMGTIDGDEATSHVTGVLVDTTDGTQLFKGNFFSDPMNVDQFQIELATSIKLGFQKAGL